MSYFDVHIDKPKVGKDHLHVELNDLKSLNAFPNIKVFVKRPATSFDDLLGFEKEKIKKCKQFYLKSDRLNYQRYEINQAIQYFKKLNPKTTVSIHPDDVCLEGNAWLFTYNSFSDFLEYEYKVFRKNVIPQTMVGKQNYMILLEVIPPMYRTTGKLWDFSEGGVISDFNGKILEFSEKDVNSDPRMSHITKHFLGLKCTCKSCLVTKK